MITLIVIDNMDSFIYNLVDQIRSFNIKTIIYRNTISINLLLKKISKIKKPIIMLSPGPGKPSNSGCMPSLIKKLKGKVPIIGICLGHQAIVESYGGKTEQSIEILHGKSSPIIHDNKYMFSGVQNPLYVARYHSLICRNIPKTLIVNSKFKNMVMSVINNYEKICGFQFHPESILTTHGTLLLRNIINWAIN